MADDMDSPNSAINPDRTYYDWAIPLPPIPSVTTNVEGDVTIVTTINGASGPNIDFTSSIGFTFTGGVGGSVVFSVSNAVLARAALVAAKSGINTDITELNGASQVDVSSDYKVNGIQVVTDQQAAIPDATGGVTIDAEARTAINALLAALRIHGLIDT